MNIGFNGLIIDKNKAGIGHYGYNLIKSLINNESENYTFFLQDSIKVEYGNVHYKKSYNKSFQRILDEQLVLPFKYKKCDLVHFIDYSSPFIKINKPFIVTIHDLAFYKYPETFSKGSRKLKQTLTPLSVKRAARIIADSENTKKDLISYFANVEDKIRVIYPGRPNLKKVKDKESIDFIKAQYNIHGDYILAVGTIEPRKNLERLLQAYKIILEQYKDIKLVLIGKSGWLYEGIYKTLKSLSIKDNIVITGYVPDEHMPYLYSGASVFAYPSLYEGFGLPPLEAMCCEVPVVVSNASSLPEVVGDAGVYCDPYDIESISSSVLKVLNDSSLRESLVRKGLEQSLKYDWNNAAKEVIEVYKEIIKY